MIDIHSKPIAERIDWLFELAHRHGKTFVVRKRGWRANDISLNTLPRLRC